MCRTLLIIVCFCSFAMAGALDDAQRFYGEGKIAEALEQFELAGQKDPNEVTLLYNLANCHYKLGQQERAVELFERILEQEQESALAAKVHFNLGNCTLQMAMTTEGAKLDDVLKELQEAVRHYRESLRINPDDADAKHNIALVSSAMGQVVQQIQQQKQQQEKQQEQQEELAKKIEELLERQTDLIQGSSTIGQAEQMAMVDPNFIINMRGQLLTNQQRLMQDSSVVRGEAEQMKSQLQGGGAGSAFETVTQEMELAVTNQAEAVSGLGGGPMVRVVGDQGEAAQHLKNALDALRQEQEEENQDQQQGDDQENSEEQDQQQENQQEQEGEDSDEQQEQEQEQQEGEEEQSNENPGEEGAEQESQEVKPLDQTAQEILDKEKERQENKRRVIIRGGGGVEKNW